MPVLSAPDSFGDGPAAVEAAEAGSTVRVLAEEMAATWG